MPKARADGSIRVDQEESEFEPENTVAWVPLLLACSTVCVQLFRGQDASYQMIKGKELTRLCFYRHNGCNL